MGYRDNGRRRDRSRQRGDFDPAAFRPLLLLAVTVFIDLLGFGIILPNLPQYVERAAGTDHRYAALIGALIAASYSFTQFLFAPLWGRYSDRVGRRPIILLSLVGVGLAYILFGFADRHLWMLFAARLLAGVLSSASIGVAFAYVADVTTPERRAQGIGLLGACFGLGFMMGPAVGGLLGHYNLSLPAFVAAGMALVNFFFTLRFLPESLPKEERERLAHLAGARTRSTLSLLSQVIRGPAGFLFALTFLVTFGFSALEQTFSFYLLAKTSFAVSGERQPLISGAILGMAGLVGVIIQGGMIGPLVVRFGEGAIARAGIALMVVGFAVLPLPSSVWGMALGPMLLLSAGRALTAPSLSALVSNRAQLGQGLTLSTSQSFDSLARTVGPVTAGALFQYVGPSSPYLVSSVVMAAGLLLAWAKRREMTSPAPTGGMSDPLAAVEPPLTEAIR